MIHDYISWVYAESPSYRWNQFIGRMLRGCISKILDKEHQFSSEYVTTFFLLVKEKEVYVSSHFIWKKHNGTTRTKKEKREEKEEKKREKVKHDETDVEAPVVAAPPKHFGGQPLTAPSR